MWRKSSYNSAMNRSWLMGTITIEETRTEFEGADAHTHAHPSVVRGKAKVVFTFSAICWQLGSKTVGSVWVVSQRLKVHFEDER